MSEQVHGEQPHSRSRLESLAQFAVRRAEIVLATTAVAVGGYMATETSMGLAELPPILYLHDRDPDPIQSLTHLDKLPHLLRHRKATHKHGHHQPEHLLHSFPVNAAYVASDQNGYVRGYVDDDDTILDAGRNHDFVDYKGRTWKLGKVLRPGHPTDSECGWMIASKVEQLKTVQVPDICTDQIKKMRVRKSFARVANGKEHQYDGGSLTPVQIKSTCIKNSLYLNYDETTHHAYDRLPVTLNTGMHWRYITKDGKKIVGQVILNVVSNNRPEQVSVWANASVGCFPRKLPHNGHAITQAERPDAFR